jgi:pentatricopeptide repeat protein
MQSGTGHVDEGIDLFQQADAKGTSTWNALSSGLVQKGRQSDVLRLLHEMMGAGMLPNAANTLDHHGFSTVLNPNVTPGAKQAHGYVIRNNYHQSDNVKSAVIDSYSKAGFLDIPRKVFELN